MNEEITLRTFILLVVFIGLIILSFYFPPAFILSVFFGVLYLQELITENEHRLKDIQQALKRLEERNSEKKE
jgi:hypothetical protein